MASGAGSRGRPFSRFRERGLRLRDALRVPGGCFHLLRPRKGHMPGPQALQ